MIRRAQVVATARSWLGTPFHHQGRLKGVGVDCAGVIVGTAAELGLSAFDRTGYGHRPDSRELEELCGIHMRGVRLSAARPADVMLLMVDGQPQHLAFVTDLGMLHAYAPSRRVVEHRIDESWRSRIVAAFRIPGVR
jgi:cell wall-associated NlpC family hydrolase